MNVALGTLQNILSDPDNPGAGQPVGLSQYYWGAGVALAGLFLAATDWFGVLGLGGSFPGIESCGGASASKKRDAW